MTTEILTAGDVLAVTLAPAVPAAITPTIVALEGFEDYDGTEFRLQHVAIAQTAKQMGDWDAKQGQFHSSVTGEIKDTLDAVILAVKQGQWWGPTYEESMKAKGAGGEVKSYCKSNNGKIPDADIANPPARACAACPNFKGVRDVETSTYTPPKCTKMRRVVIEEKDWGPAVFTARKGQCSTVDSAIQAFLAKNKHPMGVRWTISTKRQEDGNNVWFAPEFKARNDEPTSPEEQAAYQETLRAFLPTLSNVTESDSHGDEGIDAPVAGQSAGPATGPASAPVAPPIIDATIIPPADDLGF